MKIDYEDILLEWSYRLPKGFPTIVDGKFGDKDEVDLLNVILLEKGLNIQVDMPLVEGVYMLNEARPHNHITASYVPNQAYVAKWQSIGIEDLTIFEERPFVAVGLAQISTRDTLITIRINQITKVKGQSVKSLKDDYTFWKSDALNNTYLAVYKSATNLVTEFKGGASTDTDIKEGLVFAMFNSTLDTPFTAQNYNNQIKALTKSLTKSKDLGKTAYARVSSFLVRAGKEKPNARMISVFNETLSQAIRLRDYAGFKVERGQLFKQIRDAASSISGVPADKWCPGDVYLIKAGADSNIQASIAKAIQNKEIGYINSLFINEWGKKSSATSGVIIAASLKMSQAQAGKAKAYLKKFTKDDTTFNVSPAEQKLSFKGIKLGIARLRQDISNTLRKSKEVKFQYIVSPGKFTDENLARNKYASLKLINYLLSREKDPAWSIKGALQFGMSLSGINPTFYKLVGKTDGSPAEVELYEAGDEIYFFTEQPKIKPTITAMDRDSNNSVIFGGTIVHGDAIQDFVFQSRSNGNTQATLEIQKLKTRKN